MAVGNSGRLVIEIDPELKRRLHQTLREDGTNLKDWFLLRALAYLEEKSPQKPLLDSGNEKGRAVA